MTERRDIHQEITDAIVAEIEAGRAKGEAWQLPWTRATASGFPTNATTGAQPDLFAAADAGRN